MDKGKELQKLLSEFDSLDASDSAKSEAKNFVKFLADKTKKPSFMNFVFVGGPGTGKTSVAKHLAKCLDNLGYLNSSIFVKATKTDMVSLYEGQSSVKTNAILEKSSGGVLFIDDASQFAKASSDENISEALNTIIKHLKNKPHDLTIILSGMKQDIEQIFQNNAEMKNFFPTVITFS